MNLAKLGLVYLRHRPLLIFSAVAIALGVAVLFTVLAVMNGFLFELEKSIRSLSGDATIEANITRNADQNTLADYQQALAEVPGIAKLEARLNWYGLVGRRGGQATNDPRSADLSGLMLVGVDEGFESYQTQDSSIPIKMGGRAATSLGLKVGDTLGVISFLNGRRGKPMPVRISLQLVDTFSTGRYDQDLNRALLRRADLAKFLRQQRDFSEISITAQAGVDPLRLADDIEAQLQVAGLAVPGWRSTQSWRHKGGNLLRAVENQRGMLSIVFFFIVLVAAYQLVATLTLTVTEKRRDIGILRALGATPGCIVRFFVTLGILISVVGVALGLLLGNWLIDHLSTVEKWIGGGQPIFRAEIYKFDHIPVAVDPPSVLLLVIATLVVAILFSLLPAWRASRLRVIDTLRKR
jgi:lipoprotein-releasing system permease protein